jgi:ADP-heptose:LPS heptosyltransferase
MDQEEWFGNGTRALQQIAIVRALPGLGDFLCAIPALRAFRKAYPQTKITLIALANSRSLVDRFHTYIDEFVEFPGYPVVRDWDHTFAQVMDRRPQALAIPVAHAARRF